MNADLLAQLAGYQASGRITPEEQENWARLVEFVRTVPQCFERSWAQGHVTGSAWLLNATRDACLLTHHKKLNKWLQPGGHADGDPNILRVALREAAEESGIAGIIAPNHEIFDVDIHWIPDNPKEKGHWHYDVRYFLLAPPGADFVVSEESHALAWVPKGLLTRYTTERSMLRLGEKWAL